MVEPQCTELTMAVDGVAKRMRTLGIAASGLDRQAPGCRLSECFKPMQDMRRRES